MYKVIKDNYTLAFTKNTKGLILKLSHKKSKDNKYFSIIAPGNVFIFNKDWELLDTSTLKHEKESNNYIEKSSYDLIKVILLFPIVEPLTLNYDEMFFLEALTYDLFMNCDNMSKWLPLGNEYVFSKGQLISKFEGQTYEYDMPSNLDISLEDFLNKENKFIKKRKNLKTVIKEIPKIPLKLSPSNKKITHYPDSPIRVPLAEPEVSKNTILPYLPVISSPRINNADITTEEITETETIEMEKTATTEVESETDEN